MERFIEKYKDERFDMIIIGGGITGSAVAYDAASRGLTVALVEKKDFGAETSAYTSKLIHGGLRYLKNMEFGLVRESLRERRILENIAPNLVYPIPNMVTTYNNKFMNNKWIIKAAMILYDILSYDKKNTWDRSKQLPSHRDLSRDEVIELEPNVKREGLTGASVYYDCLSIFPERLTLAFVKSAVKYGARVSNYARAEDFVVENGTVTGVSVRDLIKNKNHTIRGDLVINCAGPWADIVLSKAAGKEPDQQIRRSEGIHIITRKLINDHLVSSMTPEGRHFFLIPWRGHSLIGTTDKEYIGSPDDYTVTRESIQELIDDVNASFGNKKQLSYKDVQYYYGGLRPLVEDQTEEVYESSRKYEIYDNAKDGLDGLITVEGGKYTTSRNLAEQVMKIVKKKIDRPLKRVITHNEYLYGSEIENLDSFISRAVAQNSDFDKTTVEYLARNYGTEYTRVIEIARKNKKLAELLNDDGEILAEVVYAIRHEMAKTLDDILMRRTGFGTLGNPGEKILKRIAETAKKELKWSDERVRKELAQVRKDFKIPA